MTNFKSKMSHIVNWKEYIIFTGLRIGHTNLIATLNFIG